MEIVSAKRTRCVPFGIGAVSTTGLFEKAARPGGTSRVTPKTAFRSGSSKHGKARLASVASNCVVAIVRMTPSRSTKVER